MTDNALQPVVEYTASEVDERVQNIGDEVRAGRLSAAEGRREIAAVYVNSTLPKSLLGIFKTGNFQDRIDLAGRGDELVINKLLVSGKREFYQFDQADQQSFSGWVQRLVRAGKLSIFRDHNVATRASLLKDEEMLDLAPNPRELPTSASLDPETTVLDRIIPKESIVNEDEELLKKFRTREERVYVLAQIIHRTHRIPPLVRPTNPVERLEILRCLRQDPHLAARSLVNFRKIITGTEITEPVDDMFLALWDSLTYDDVETLETKVSARETHVIAEAACMTLLRPNRSGVAMMRKHFRPLVSSEAHGRQWRDILDQLIESFLARECEIASRHANNWKELSSDDDVLAEHQRHADCWEDACARAIDFPEQPLGGDAEEILNEFLEVWELAFHATSLADTTLSMNDPGQP